MKKIISMLITFCLVMSSAAVFAEAETTEGDTSSVVNSGTATTGEDETSTNIKKADRQAVRAEKQAAKAQKIAVKQGNKAQKDALRAELKAVKDQMKANREIIKGLSAQVRELHKKAVVRIKEIVKDKESLTQETVDELKDMLAQLRDARVEIAGTRGKIVEECLDMGIAKKNKDAEKIKNGLNNVLDVQKTRIQKLNSIIEALNNISGYKAE